MTATTPHAQKQTSGSAKLRESANVDEAEEPTPRKWGSGWPVQREGLAQHCNAGEVAVNHF